MLKLVVVLLLVACSVSFGQEIIGANGSGGGGGGAADAYLFNDSDTLPDDASCDAGDYWLRADTSETALLACENGTESNIVTLAEQTVVVKIDLDDSMVSSTGDGKYYFPVDSALNGYTLTGVSLFTGTPGTTSGTLTIDLTRCTTGLAICTTAADMLSTSIAVDFDEWTSGTGTAAVINTANDDVATDQWIRIDVDAIAGGTAATDVTIGFTFTPGA